MRRDRLARRCRRLLERLSQPSSAAGLAALLAVLVPDPCRACAGDRRGRAHGDRSRRRHRGDGTVGVPELPRP
jgi:hypothetical protein